MFREKLSEKQGQSSFQQILRWKLQTLERELVQAHAEQLQTPYSLAADEFLAAPDFSSLSPPVPLERQSPPVPLERQDLPPWEPREELELKLRPVAIEDAQFEKVKAFPEAKDVNEKDARKTSASIGMASFQLKPIVKMSSTCNENSQEAEHSGAKVKGHLRFSNASENSGGASMSCESMNPSDNADGNRATMVSFPSDGNRPTMRSTTSSNGEKGVQKLKLRPNWQRHEITLLKKHRKSKLAFKLDKIFSVRRQNSKLSVANLSRATARQSIAMVAQQSRQWKCIIHPFSKSWVIWEMFGFLLLVHDVVFVPMQVFNMPDNPVIETLKWTTIIYWTATFLMTFILSYQTKNGAQWEYEYKKIMCHYLKGWFWLDLFLVSSDWISVAMDFVVKNTDGGLRSARMARMARLSRMCRTMRMLRVMRIGEMMQRMESLLDSEYLIIYFLVGCNVAAILLLAHLAACTWFAIGDASESGSWLTPLNIQKASVGEQYIYSLGWSLSTLLGTTVTVAYPQTEVEYTCALIILVVGTIVVSLVFSSTTAAMTRIHEMRSGERQATFNLKQYLKQNQISLSLEARLIRYIDIARSVHAKRIPKDKVVLLNLLSGPLRLELQLELHAPHLISHPFFEMYYKINVGAMSELCLTAVNCVYLSRFDGLFQNFTQAHHMYFVVCGVMAYRRAKGAKSTRHTARIDKDKFFCEPAIWTTWVHHGGMKALIESQILALDVDLFREITESHHDVFNQACDYALEWINHQNQELADFGFVWDVPSEVMYPEKHKAMLRQTSTKFYGPTSDLNVVDIVKDAEEISAELLDFQSDSDSEDERILKSALTCMPTTVKRKHSALARLGGAMSF